MSVRRDSQRAGERLDGAFAEERAVVVGEAALVEEAPFASGVFHGSGGGCRLQQGAAGAVQALVAQVGRSG